MKFPLPTCQFTLVSCSCCCLACVCVCVCVVCVCVHTCIHHTCVSVCVRVQQSVITSECDDCQPSKIPRALLDNKPMVTLDKLSASTMWYTYRVSLGGGRDLLLLPFKKYPSIGVVPSFCLPPEVFPERNTETYYVWKWPTSILVIRFFAQTGSCSACICSWVEPIMLKLLLIMLCCTAQKVLLLCSENVQLCSENLQLCSIEMKKKTNKTWHYIRFMLALCLLHIRTNYAQFLLV